MFDLNYWLDKNNNICQLDAHWDKVLQDQHWSERASSEVIIGKPIFDFICDDVTRMYLAAMLDAVRTIPHSLFRPYRCDSPDAKRFMQMIVTPEDNGWVRITHKLLRTEPFASKVVNKSKLPTKSKQFTGNTGHSFRYVRCSFCNRLQVGGEVDWHEIDEYPLLQTCPQNTYMVAYGVCPQCLESLKK